MIRKKNGFHKKLTELVFEYGEVCKSTSRNYATFKMELFSTNANSRNLQRASTGGL